MFNNFRNLLVGLNELFGFFRDFFSSLPIVVQVLVTFAFSGFLFIALLHMIRKGR